MIATRAHVYTPPSWVHCSAWDPARLSQDPGGDVGQPGQGLWFGSAGQHDDRPVSPCLREPLDEVRVVRQAKHRDLDRPRITSRLSRELIQLLAACSDLLWRDAIGEPAIPIRHHALQDILRPATQDDRRMWLLRRFREALHRGEMNELAVKFRLVLRPQL